MNLVVIVIALLLVAFAIGMALYLQVPVLSMLAITALLAANLVPTSFWSEIWGFFKARESSRNR